MRCKRTTPHEVRDDIKRPSEDSVGELSGQAWIALVFHIMASMQKEFANAILRAQKHCSVEYRFPRIWRRVIVGLRLQKEERL
jgi:hypothetical protein